MTHVFYFFMLLYLIKQILDLFQIKEKVDKSRRIRILTKEFKGKKWAEYPEEYKSDAMRLFYLVPYLILVFMGLITAQWFVFFLEKTWTIFFVNKFNETLDTHYINSDICV